MAVRQGYSEELEAISNEFVRMGAMAIASMDKAFTAIDTGNVELADDIMAEDWQLNRVEHEIGRRCHMLLLRQQPLARDLRRVLVIYKMVGSLKEVGNIAASIACATMRLPLSLPGELSDVKRMAAAAREMVSDSIKAFTSESLVLADYVRRRDDIVNSYFDSIKNEIAMYITENPAEAATGMEYLMVIRHIQRLGDHAVHLSDWVTFYKTGQPA